MAATLSHAPQTPDPVATSPSSFEMRVSDDVVASMYHVVQYYRDSFQKRNNGITDPFISRHFKYTLQLTPDGERVEVRRHSSSRPDEVLGVQPIDWAVLCSGSEAQVMHELQRFAVAILPHMMQLRKPSGKNNAG